jgi:hypothetical protein
VSPAELVLADVDLEDPLVAAGKLDRLPAQRIKIVTEPTSELATDELELRSVAAPPA